MIRSFISSQVPRHHGRRGRCLEHVDLIIRNGWAYVITTHDNWKQVKNSDSSTAEFCRFISNISNTRDSVSSGYPNTEKRVENTTRSGVLLMKLEVFG